MSEMGEGAVTGRRFGKTAYEEAYESLDDYQRGWLACLDLYAYMKDGVYYVGSTGRTRRAAAVAFLTDAGKAEAAAILYPERRP